MNKTKQPLFHIVKRGEMPWYFSWCIRAAALVIALVCCGVISTLVTSENPIKIYATIIDGSFGSNRKFMVLLQNTAMLLCVALALTPAFKMRFWNIGGEGQALIGALASAACMILMKQQSNWVVIPCMIDTSFMFYQEYSKKGRYLTAPLGFVSISQRSRNLHRRHRHRRSRRSWDRSPVRPGG